MDLTIPKGKNRSMQDPQHSELKFVCIYFHLWWIMMNNNYITSHHTPAIKSLDQGLISWLNHNLTSLLATVVCLGYVPLPPAPLPPLAPPFSLPEHRRKSCLKRKVSNHLWRESSNFSWRVKLSLDSFHSYLFHTLTLVNKTRETCVHSRRELLASPQQSPVPIGRLDKHDDLMVQNALVSVCSRSVKWCQASFQQSGPDHSKRATLKCSRDESAVKKPLLNLMLDLKSKQHTEHRLINRFVTTLNPSVNFFYLGQSKPCKELQGSVRVVSEFL
jgi:hypothetical protein